MHFESEFSEAETSAIAKDFTRLKDKCYLDHAGATLYAESQIRAAHEQLAQQLLCNPHTSRSTEDLIDQVRFRLLRHFNTRSSEYQVIFTSGTTASLKLVAESFAFEDGGAFVYLRDSHTSVLGMREVVGTDRICPLERDVLLQNLDTPKESNVVAGGISSLLVFPAQCNFNGVKYQLELIKNIKDHGLIGYERERFYMCVDAASYVSTSFLDLSKYKPDFVCLSFYKIFGFPTGLGALLVRHNAVDTLNKSYYGGGTVKIAMSGKNFHVKRDSLTERFEDGTIAFTSIVSLLNGFYTLERLAPSANGLRVIERVSKQTFLLARYCYRRLRALRHANDREVIKLYHDTDFEDPKQQGAIVNFNVLHDDGSFVGFAEFSYMAQVHDIILRTGCFCNPGACQRLLGLTDEDVLRQYDAGHICGDANDLIDGQPTGSVRVSFGYMTRKEEIDRLLDMIQKCYIKKMSTKTSVSRSEIVLQYKNYLQPRLKMICLFPIKSCGAFKVTSSWPLCSKGLKYDREFVIVDENGMALTQKKCVEMCLIVPRVDLRAQELILTHPSMADHKLDMSSLINASESQLVKLCQTKVCQDNIQAIDCGDEVADWISIALQTSGLRLLRQSDEETRTFRQSTKAISLSNQAQFLLINQTSVHWLADQVPDWDDMPNGKPSLSSLVDRFRGNLIIETSRPMEENSWNNIVINGQTLSVDGPCSRCQMVCIDQATGTKTTEPLRTIAREFKGKMRFGIYLSFDYLKDGSDNRLIHCGSSLTIHRSDVL
ncbi:molybdenum cofactor sulfurase 3 [Uranotaenia lowii]|uniref:molybdenum cofactor sulfurase 3 n=1 Tax=Uranotaenia lowii TaxID=190385 RepID=UPI00247975EA|nr:molybdenum cofactor sulfurase 3 [Uranotaenia lowii]